MATCWITVVESQGPDLPEYHKCNRNRALTPSTHWFGGAKEAPHTQLTRNKVLEFHHCRIQKSAGAGEMVQALRATLRMVL
jgi:hypothetical protein